MTSVEYLDFLQWNDTANLTMRAYNALKRDDVNTVKELEAKTICELRDYRNVGRGTVANILAALKEYNGHELTCEHDNQSCIAWLEGKKGH
jgi:DNA-directed RNA polymerase alpha subunit